MLAEKKIISIDFWPDPQWRQRSPPKPNHAAASGSCKCLLLFQLVESAVRCIATELAVALFML